MDRLVTREALFIPSGNTVGDEHSIRGFEEVLPHEATVTVEPEAAWTQHDSIAKEALGVGANERTTSYRTRYEITAYSLCPPGIQPLPGLSAVLITPAGGAADQR